MKWEPHLNIRNTLEAISGEHPSEWADLLTTAEFAVENRGELKPLMWYISILWPDPNTLESMGMKTENRSTEVQISEVLKIEDTVCRKEYTPKKQRWKRTNDYIKR